MSANASSTLLQALQTGDPAYDPSSAITLSYTSARNQVLTLAVAVPAIMGLVNPLLGRITVNSTAGFLGTANETQIKIALGCGSCLTEPFVVRSVDLIAFKPPAAFGVLNTGLIFVCSRFSSIPSIPF